MAGFLEGYGTSEVRREKTVLWLVGTAIGLAILAVVLFFYFRNYREERLVKAFLQDLQRKDHRAAYALWGCTEAQPCPQYSFDKFMEDWGPQSVYGDAGGGRVAQVNSCDTGIIETIEFPGKPDAQLWVDRRNFNIGFAPWTLRRTAPGFVPWLRGRMWEMNRDCRGLIAR
ncbi:MAG TPA: hypothetical protein VMZ52_04870 [Bryobacteraceae bacterium]|nr:hypothetical protein [Bryobacteraceae bacterium]